MSAEMRMANLEGANLEQARPGANSSSKEPTSQRANLTGANLRGANLTRSQPRKEPTSEADANLEGTNLEDVKVDERVAEQIREFNAKQTRP